MNANKLDKIIKRFWANHNNNTIYYLGKCSEFAVALDRFLKGKGKIGKHGWFHTIYIYDGYLWDVRGKQTKHQLDFNMPIGATDEPRPARPDEIQHIMGLLNEPFTQHIVKELKERTGLENISSVYDRKP